MADEQTLAEMVSETPAVPEKTVETSAAQDADDQATAVDAAETEGADEGEAGEGDESGQVAEPEVELEEVDLDGEKLKLPKKVAERLWAKETAEARMAEAEEARKAIEMERVEMQALAKRTEDDLRLDAQLTNLEDLISQYKQVDWLRLARENGDEATALKFQYEAIKEQHAELLQTKNTRREAQLTEIRASTDARIREADDWASTNIPGWNQGKDRELLDFAKAQFGYTDVQLAQKIDKSLVQLLHFARIGHQVHAKANTQPAPETKPAPPLRTVKSAKSTTGAASASSLVTASEKDFGAVWEKHKHRTLASL